MFLPSLRISIIDSYHYRLETNAVTKSQMIAAKPLHLLIQELGMFLITQPQKFVGKILKK